MSTKPNKTFLKEDKYYCIISQFATHPDYRNQRIGTKLWNHVEDMAYKDRLDAIYLDTAEPATQLVDWYLRLGCNKIGYLSHSNTNYYSVVFRKTVIGKKYNRLYLSARYFLSKTLCILQYRNDGKMRVWRKAISQIKRCFGKQ